MGGPAVLTTRALTVSGLMELVYNLDPKDTIAAVLTLFIVIAYVTRPMVQEPGRIRGINRMMVACMALLGLILYLRILELAEYWG